MNMNIKIFECSYQQCLKLKGLDETICKYAETSLLDLVHEKLKDKEQFVDDILIKYGELALREDTHFIFATNEQDEVVGLCVYIMDYYEHALAKNAHIDCLFLDKEYRKQGNGTAFMKFIFENAKKNGASLCFVSANAGSKTNRVFGKMFKPMFNIFVKEL